jgi:O-antigen/teichoic acid export membrane protein
MKSSLLFSSAVCFICGNLLSTFCTAVYNAKNDFVLPAVLSIVINILLLIVLPYHGRSTLIDISQTNYLDLYFISFLIYAVALLLVAKWRYPVTSPGIFIKAGEFRGLFRYSVMAFLGNIIFFLLYRIDYWFVERYCTPGQLGNYIQVSKLGQLFFVLPTILAAVIFPLTAGGQRAGINRILPLVARSILTLYRSLFNIIALQLLVISLCIW